MAYAQDLLLPRRTLVNLIRVHTVIFEDTVAVGQAAGACLDQGLIYVDGHPAAVERCAVLLKILPVFTPCIPPDVAGGCERDMTKVIRVDGHLFV